MLSSKISEKRGSKVIIFVIALLMFTASSWAEDLALPEITEAKKLKLMVGKSIVIRSPKAVKRISIAAPEIADFILLSPRQIYITGKAEGITNLTLWQDKKMFTIYDLEVAIDFARLKERLQEVLPDESDISVIITDDSITLSGKVSSTANLTQALALAEAFAPKGKVTNLLEVGGVHQVMLEVRVAEISRSLVKKLGVNFNYVEGGDFGVSTLGGLSQVVSPDNANLLTEGALSFLVSPAVNALFRFHSGSASWTGLIDALKEDGLVKILAEPTLIALSGQTASFLAGGEFPVPVPQGLGSVAIEYKSFGVGLSFTPTVLSQDKININVMPEISELDFSTALQFGGFVIPGLSTRKAATVVELADGQSFAIAGLLRETIRDDISKYPLLGKIPILGTLFRSRAFQKNETELIIIATPHLVKPLDSTKQPLPTDFYKEPNDIEFHVLGLMEGKEKNKPLNNKPVATEGGLDGEFGHAIPVSE